VIRYLNKFKNCLFFSFTPGFRKIENDIASGKYNSSTEKQLIKLKLGLGQGVVGNNLSAGKKED
jgi:hypothetical protein